MNETPRAYDREQETTVASTARRRLGYSHNWYFPNHTTHVVFLRD
jgi:hypothetical protein